MKWEVMGEVRLGGGWWVREEVDRKEPSCSMGAGRLSTS